MINQELKTFVDRSRSSGLSDQKIRELLLPQGWTQDDINSVLNPNDQLVVPSTVIHKSSKTLLKLIILIILLIILVGGGYILYKKQTITSTILGTENPINSVPNQENTISPEPVTTLDEAIPITRELKPEQFTNGLNYSFEKITFSVPWSNLIKKTDGKNSLRLQFNDNKIVAVLEKETTPNHDLNVVLGNDSQKSDQLKQTFGSDSFQSTYSMNKLIYGITPEIIAATPAGLKQDMEKALLALKELTVTGGNNKFIIYNFSANNVRGFQFSTIDATNKVTDLYDTKGDSYTLLSQNVSQSEIDYILSSVKGE